MCDVIYVHASRVWKKTNFTKLTILNLILIHTVETSVTWPVALSTASTLLQLKPWVIYKLSLWLGRVSLTTSQGQAPSCPALLISPFKPCTVRVRSLSLNITSPQRAIANGDNRTSANFRTCFWKHKLLII